MNAVRDPAKLAAAPSLYASHHKVYTKDVYGPVRSAKSAIMVVCLAVYYTLPWLRWNRGPGVPDQALLLDLWHERFYFFDIVLWPQDIYLLTGLLVLAAVSLFLVTSLFGRVWCGYACPQTVWTDLFMQVERWTEGDRNARMKRDAGPWTRERVLRKLATHWIWFWVAFWTGGAWIMYFVNAPVMVGEFWSGRASPEVYAMTLLFTLTTYLLAGWAREQVCTFMCPWPRFQSAMLDEQSLVVTYQTWRGEPRGHGKTDAGGKFGDCVDCAACLHVCPTGIDIRNGIQLECINCGLCVDACNHVMEKLDRAPGLITWDTLAGQKAKAVGQPKKFRFVRARTIIYAGVLALCAGLVVYGVLTRATTNLSVIHDRAPLFITLESGAVRNGYTVKLANKLQVAASSTLTLRGLPGGLLALPEQSPVFGTSVRLAVPAGEVGTFRLLVQGTLEDQADQRTLLQFELHNEKTGETRDYTAPFFTRDND